MPISHSTGTSLAQPPETLDRCCGSRVVYPDSRRKLTGEFRRQAKGPVIHLLQVPNGGIDLMPPARIGDLKLELIKGKSTILATWTAPGDDFSTGSVSGYRFVYARDTSVMINPFDPNYQTLAEFRRPDAAGVSTSYQFAFSQYDEDFYVGLIAYDERKNEGKMSNIVLLNVNSEDVPAGAALDPKQTPVSASGPRSSDEGVMIGVLCGTFAVIACMLWAGIWYLRNHHHKGGGVTKKNGGVNATLVSNHSANGDAGHDTSSSDLDVKSLPQLHNGHNGHNGPIVPQFSSLAAGGPVGTYPGRNGTANGAKDDDGTTPTYWSASQLLNEHEQRQFSENVYSSTTYHNNQPLPLDPIVEDPEDTYGISEMYNQHHLRQQQQQQHQMATSTPVKYATMTFPRNNRNNQSVSPSPVSDSLMLPPHSSGGVLPHHNEVLYGYAQSEPPTSGLYGTLQQPLRSHSRSGMQPPAIPPKPSLSALLGLQQEMDLGGDGDASRPKRSNSSDNLSSANNGLTVRNISQV